MGVESEAKLLLALIETVCDDLNRGPVDKVEQIFDLLTSPAAAWLAGKTQREVFSENPFYVLLLMQPDKPGCYSNESGSPNLTEIAARARQAIRAGAKYALVVQMVEQLP